jgi:hypothetical protein
VTHEVLLDVDGRPMWQLGDALLPVIAGGSGDAGGGGDSDGGQGQGDGGTITKPGGTPDTAGTAGDEPGDEPPDNWPPEAKKTFRKLRDIAKQAEKREQDAVKALQTRSQQGMSEAEQQAARLRELETDNARKGEQIRVQAMREAFREAGTVSGARNPSAVWKLIDRESVDWGPDNEVLNATELVRELKRAEPWAFEPKGPAAKADAAQGPHQQAATSGTDQTRNKQMNEWFRSAAGRGG